MAACEQNVSCPGFVTCQSLSGGGCYHCTYLISQLGVLVTDQSDGGIASSLEGKGGDVPWWSDTSSDRGQPEVINEQISFICHTFLEGDNDTSLIHALQCFKVLKQSSKNRLVTCV